MKVEGIVDVFHKVKEMRIQRPGIVQTLVGITIHVVVVSQKYVFSVVLLQDQYKLCYIIVMGYIDTFDTYANFK